MIIIAITMVVLLAAVLSAVMRSLALRYQLIDVPNERSSHVVPTPGAGGVAIVVASLVGVALGLLFDLAYGVEVLTSLFLALTVAAVGYIDDYRGVSPGWRLLTHVGAAVTVAWVADAPQVVAVAAVLAVAWLVNLFNFMDGIDGLASVEAVSVCLVGGVLLGLNESYALAWLSICISAASLGFLSLNWPPAKIFMGDVGSGFLGFLCGALAFFGHVAGALHVIVWLILLGVFIVDATWTVCRRALSGARVYEAHRSHGYQRAAVLLGSHRAVTLAVIGINVLWLLPLALAAAYEPDWRWWFLVVAWTPLCVLAYKLGAGTEPTACE